jgi:hypothetical protein
MNNFRRSASFGIALLAAGLLATPLTVSAQATDPSKKTPAKQSTGKSKPKTMSRDQLRACMDQQDRVTAMREKVLQEESSLDKQRAEIKRMDAELATKRAALDPADAAAKEALGAEEEKRNQIAEAFNARLPVLREQANAVNAERQSWVERCADKDFDEIDEYAIKRERQRAAKAAGSSSKK